MITLAIIAKFLAAKVSVHLVCAGNSYMMLDENKEYLKNCQKFIMFDDEIVFETTAD